MCYLSPMKTKRYPFRYAEYLAQQRWAGLSFAPKSGFATPLEEDISNRMTGQPFQTGRKVRLLKLGILSTEKLLREINASEWADDFGADAVRLALFLERGKITDTKLTAHWRFMQKAGLLFDGAPIKMPTKKQLQNPLFFPIIDNWQKNNLKNALISTKRAVNAAADPAATLFFLYPFCPHVATYYRPDIHEKMASFYAKIKKIKVPAVYFIELNGKWCGSFYPTAEAPQKIIKEALSLSELQNKIKNRKIKDVVFIKGKGLNFVI